MVVPNPHFLLDPIDPENLPSGAVTIAQKANGLNATAYAIVIPLRGIPKAAQGPLLEAVLRLFGGESRPV